MNTFYALFIAAGIISLIWLLFNTFFSTSYRCSKCGYETESRIEALAHEKIENSHKMLS